MPAPGQVEGVEGGALVEGGRLGRVEVLGLPVPQGAPAEAGDLAPGVPDGEHHPGPEAVVQPALVLEGQPGALDLLLRQPPALEVDREAVPALGGPAQGEALHRLQAHPAPAEVLPRLGPFGGPQEEVVEPGAGLVQGVRRRLGLGVGAGGLALGEAHPGPVGQLAQGLAEVQPLRLLHPGEDVPALGAAEAVVGAAVGVDVEGGRLLLVEGAQALEAAPGLLQRHRAGDEIDDVDALLDLVDRGVGHRSACLTRHPGPQLPAAPAGLRRRRAARRCHAPPRSSSTPGPAPMP